MLLKLPRLDLAGTDLVSQTADAAATRADTVIRKERVNPE